MFSFSSTISSLSVNVSFIWLISICNSHPFSLPHLIALTPSVSLIHLHLPMYTSTQSIYLLFTYPNIFPSTLCFVAQNTWSKKEERMHMYQYVCLSVCLYLSISHIRLMDINICRYTFWILTNIFGPLLCITCL